MQEDFNLMSVTSKKVFKSSKNSFMTKHDFPAQDNQFLGQRSNFKVSHLCPLISLKNQAFSPPI